MQSLWTTATRADTWHALLAGPVTIGPLALMQLPCSYPAALRLPLNVRVKKTLTQLYVESLDEYVESLDEM